ncbi:MAG: hypothetical protein ACI9OE_001947, partial [Mariniflexile sp.]
KEPNFIVENPSPVILKTKDSIQENNQIEPEIMYDSISIKMVDKIGSNTKSIEIFNHDSWDILLKNHVSIKGHVDYNSFKSNKKELSNYIASLSTNMPQESWNKQEKLAYWINAYNALTIDLILRHYPIKSIKEIKDPWGQRLWKLGEKWYNLEEIEHQILRKMDEPRIHFAIVCASFSCPKLLNEAYSAQNLDAQLTQATKDFLSDPKRNIITENHLSLSKIFQWFSKDFKQQGTLVDFLNTYSDVKISNKAKKTFIDYNWDLNE